MHVAKHEQTECCVDEAEDGERERKKKGNKMHIQDSCELRKVKLTKEKLICARNK